TSPATVYIVVDGYYPTPYTFDLTTVLGAPAERTISAFDPNRPSVPFECQGATVSMAQVVRLFDAAFDQINFNGNAQFNARSLGRIPVQQYVKTCHPVTGC